MCSELGLIDRLVTGLLKRRDKEEEKVEEDGFPRPTDEFKVLEGLEGLD